MRIGRVGFVEPGLDVKAVVRLDRQRQAFWRFRMWLLLSIWQCGICVVRNDGSRGRR